MSEYKEYILRVPLMIEEERYKYISERATAFLGYPLQEEVVRCRDCQYCDEERSLCCKGFDWVPVESDGFCKWGKPNE